MSTVNTNSSSPDPKKTSFATGGDQTRPILVEGGIEKRVALDFAKDIEVARTLNQAIHEVTQDDNRFGVTAEFQQEAFDPFGKTQEYFPQNRDSAATGILSGIVRPDEFDFELYHSNGAAPVTNAGGKEQVTLHDSKSMIRQDLVNYDLLLELSSQKLDAAKDHILVPGDTTILNRLESFDHEVDVVFGSLRLSPNSDNSETIQLFKDYDQAFQAMMNQGELEPDDSFRTMLHLSTQNLYDKGDIKHFLGIFKKHFSKTFPESSLKDSAEDAFLVFQELTKQHLKAKVAFSAQKIIETMSEEDKMEIFKSCVSERKKQYVENTSLVRELLPNITANLESDRDFISPDFYQNIYETALIHAVISKLGADRLKLAQGLSKIENSENFKELKKVITIAQTKRDGTSFENIPALSSFAGEPEFPLQEDKAIEAIKSAKNSLVSALSDQYEILKGIHDEDFQDKIALWAINSIKLIAQAKIETVYKSVKDRLLKNPDFMKALKTSSKKQIHTILEQYVPEEVLNNPLRRYFLAKKIDGDFEFQNGIKKIPSPIQRMTASRPLRYLAGTLATLGSIGGIAKLATDYQTSKDPYVDASGITGITDSIPLLKDEVVKNTQNDLSEQRSWINKKVFHLDELMNALNRNILVENKQASLIAKILDNSDSLKSMSKNNPLMISLNIEKNAENKLDLEALSKELEQRLTANTDILSNLKTQEEKEQFTRGIIENFNSVFQSFYSIKKHAPTFCTEISIDNPSKPGEKTVLAIVNTSYLKDLLIDIEKEDPKLRNAHLQQLSASIAQTGRSLAFKDLITESYGKYTRGELQPTEAAFDLRTYNMILDKSIGEVNRVGLIIDRARDSMGLEALK